MAVYATTGAKLHIATGNNALSTPADATAYAALTWTEVKEVESYGDFGDSASLITFSAVGDKRVRKIKGAFDAGNLAVTVGRDALDTGQSAVRTAAGSPFKHNFRITLADNADANDTPTLFYFGALVTEAPNQLGNNGDVTKQRFQLAITTAITEVPAAVVA